MKPRLQFAGWLLTLPIAAGLTLSAAAQRKQERQEPRQERQQPNQNRSSNRPPGANRPVQPPASRREDRPPETNPRAADRRLNNENIRPRQQLGGGAPPRWQERLRNMPPQERERILENHQKFNSLPPERQDQIRRNLQHWDRLTPLQRQEIQEREQVWQRMTPEQRQHIRNDVMPKWQQLPPERRQAIQQRLRVLQNMPESARNQRLNDPNFTRGMSEEDRAMLRDLSHQHVGSPDPPGEQPL